MLPSTGHFKGFNCPFYESGLCERPYCHFRHVRKDPETNNDGEILQQLVSEAVKKVLLHTESASAEASTLLKSQSLISKVVQEIKPSDTLSSKSSGTSKATYNPTPISELNKLIPSENESQPAPGKKEHVNRRHIPVPYTPHHPIKSSITRAPAKASPTLTLVTSHYKVASQEKYTPESRIIDSIVTYLPRSAAGMKPTPYSPVDWQTEITSTVGYTPSDPKKIAEIPISSYTPTGQSVSGVTYNPGTVVSSAYSTSSYCPQNTSYSANITGDGGKSPCYTSSLSYKPTPLNKIADPAFSSDEDEPCTKKPKLNETDHIESLESEFEILGQILEDESQDADNLSQASDKHANISQLKNDRDKVTPKDVDSSKSKIHSKLNSDHSSQTSDKHAKISQLKNDHYKVTPMDSSKSKIHSKLNSSDKHHSRSKNEKSVEKDSTECEVGSRSIEISKRDSRKGSSSSDKGKVEKSKSSSRHGSSSKSSKQEKSHSSKKKDDGRTLSKDKELKKDHKSSSSSKIHRSKSSDKPTKDTSSSKRSESKSKTAKDNLVVGKDFKSNSSSGHRDKSTRDSKSKTPSESNKSQRSSKSHSKRHDHRNSEKSSKKYSDNQSRSNTAEDVQRCDSTNMHDDENDQHNSSMSDNELIEELSDSDEETIAQECLKIFEEYVPTSKEIPSQNVIKQDVNSDSSALPGKKRVAHDTSIIKTKSIALPKHRANAVQLAADRYARVKQFHMERLKSVYGSDTENTPLQAPAVRDEPSVSSTSSSSKVRIAHVPNVSILLNAKKALKVPEVPKPTPTQTISKGTSRIAHMPNDKFSERPGVLEPLASKIAVNIRTKYLNLMIDECVKIYLTAEDAYERAQQEELRTNKKCCSIQIYKNSSILTITRLRKEIQEAGGVKINNSNSISHNQVLLGKLGQTTSWSIQNKYKKDNELSLELKGTRFYENISKWILSEDELKDNGFPRPHPDKVDKGWAKIFTQNTRQRPQKGFIRWCRRCKKEYTVDKRGFAVVKQECIYHPNNKYRFRGEVKYQCCGQDTSSDGCLSAPCHVYEYTDHDHLRGYVSTLPKPETSNGPGVYALDCEMCYTTHGLDLTRVTVIDSNLSVVYESLVKPLFPIIDYNTQFSGITEEHMNGVTTSLLEVQATFLHMFSDKTILVGHSLESDFKALKLIHNTVVDTSVLFPHKMGPPYKRALRNLTSEYLKKIIQNSIDGHDSAEDATVCMELLVWKLKEELKTR